MYPLEFSEDPKNLGGLPLHITQLFWWDGQIIQIPAVRIGTVIDPTGCGDTFTAAYAAARCGNYDVEACARYATAVAAIALQGFGPVRLTGDELQQKIDELLSTAA